MTHLEDSNEEAAVETVGALKDRHENRHLAVGRSRQPKKRTQSVGGSWQKLAAARGRLARRAIPAPRKAHCRQGWSRGSVAKEAPKGRTLERTRRTGHECSSGIKDRDLKEELRLRKEWTSGRILRKTVKLEINERIVGSSTELRNVTWHCERVGPLRNVRRDIEHSLRERNDGGTLWPAGTLSGNRSGRAALRGEQWESLESNNSENRATKKEDGADHRRHKHSPRKTGNDGTLVGYSGQIALWKKQCGMWTRC
jgi:hypothetical protein